MDKSSLGDRMKRFESVSDTTLMIKTPVIVRVDGRAFHTLTKRMGKPWDPGFVSSMACAAQALCEQLQGAKIAYGQSDEISVLLTDWEDYNTQPCFGYRLQKLTSIAASVASLAFFSRLRDTYAVDVNRCQFDARAFNLPPSEVVNYFIWRQRDAVRNSISGLAQSKFSHKKLHGKSSDEMQDMLFKDHGINWNDVPVINKRGFCVLKEEFLRVDEEGSVLATRRLWDTDKAIPEFTKDRSYIERFV